MLAELKDLVEKKLFTQTETKQILKKRTQFETALVRRVAKKADYLRYAAYEMGLEQLRRKRVQRLSELFFLVLFDGYCFNSCGTELEGIPPSLSSYALVRRQFHIFERALKKFKSDVGLWIQYIDIAKKEGAGALVGRICARSASPLCSNTCNARTEHDLQSANPSPEYTVIIHSSCIPRAGGGRSGSRAHSSPAWRATECGERGIVERMGETGIALCGECEEEMGCVGDFCGGQRQRQRQGGTRRRD